MSQGIEHLDFTPEDRELQRQLESRNTAQWDDAIGFGGLGGAFVGMFGAGMIAPRIGRYMDRYDEIAVPPKGSTPEEYAQHERNVEFGAFLGIWVASIVAGIACARALQKRAWRIEKERMDNFQSSMQP